MFFAFGCQNILNFFFQIQHFYSSYLLMFDLFHHLIELLEHRLTCCTKNDMCHICVSWCQLPVFIDTILLECCTEGNVSSICKLWLFADYQCFHFLKLCGCLLIFQLLWPMVQSVPYILHAFLFWDKIAINEFALADCSQNVIHSVKNQRLIISIFLDVLLHDKLPP